MIVGTMIVGAMIVRAMIVGAMIVGAMRLSLPEYHGKPCGGQCNWFSSHQLQK